MTNPVDFRGPYLKTERAEHHIGKLKEIFGAYVRANTQAIQPQANYNVRERSRPIGGSFPRHTSTILGDALHNLRASLDHAYCVLIEANNRTVSERSSFPFTKDTTAQNRKAAVNGFKIKGHAPSDAIIDFIFDEIQPFVGGNGDDLVKLHFLDITDKHIILLPAVQHVHIERLVTGPNSSIENLTLITSGALAIDFGPGAGLEHGYNHQATFEICFKDGQPFEGEPILPVLRKLADRVNETLRALEAKANQAT